MPESQSRFPEALRTRILERDRSVLDAVDRFLEQAQMEDERRQEVLLWVDSAMRDDKTLAELRGLTDLAPVFDTVAKHAKWNDRRRDRLRAFHERAVGRNLARRRLRRGLSVIEVDEIVRLVHERARRKGKLVSDVFEGIVFHGRTYEAMQAEVRASISDVTIDQLRSWVSRQRADLREHLSWFIVIGSADFITESRGFIP